MVEQPAIDMQAFTDDSAKAVNEKCLTIYTICFISELVEGDKTIYTPPPSLSLI